MRFRWKNIYMQTIIVWLIATFAFTNTLAQKGKENTLLWKVSGNGLKEPSYLFGTYHLLTNKFIHEYEELEKPFENSKGVVVEIVIDSAKLQGLASMALMKDQKISDLITPEDYNLVSAELESMMGVNLNMMNQLKPMSVMILMVMIQNQTLNAAILQKYKGLPMDYYLAESGKKLNKKVTALETIEEQMTLLYDHYPLQEQANQLVSFVKQKELSARVQQDLLNAYLERNLTKLYEVSDSVPDQFGNSDYLIKDRNNKWMKVLPGLMKESSQFVAVGALHLAGPDGLITQLQKSGYKVTPVSK